MRWRNAFRVERMHDCSDAVLVRGRRHILHITFKHVAMKIIHVREDGIRALQLAVRERLQQQKIGKMPTLRLEQ